jgi:hypothetical protein
VCERPKRGELVGPFSLYFGNRYVADEFLYERRAELEALHCQVHDWFKLTLLAAIMPRRGLCGTSLPGMLVSC